MSTITKLEELLEKGDKRTEVTYKALVESAPADFEVSFTTPLGELIKKYKLYYTRSKELEHRKTRRLNGLTSSRNNGEK